MRIGLRYLGSLRLRLLASLFAVIALAAVIQGGFAYRTALVEADQLFDYNMRQMALSMRSGNPLETRRGAPDGDGGLDGIDFVVQVWTGDGIRIFESSPSLVLPQRAVLGFSNVRTSRAEYRVYAIATPSRVVQVAQDLSVRRRLAGGLALRTVGPIALMMPILMLVTGWVVTRSLAPVARVREQVARREADDLSPVGTGGLPDEVRPLIDELNALLVRLRGAFDTQRHFVADAAHELRSPLAALQLQLQGLLRADDTAARGIAAERLGRGIARASRLVEQLLVLARQQPGAAQPAPAVAVDLGAVVREAIAESTPMAQARSIDLGLLGADADRRVDPVIVPGQADALAILVRNLLDNAIKYTPAGGTVDVGLEQTGPGSVRLVVEDSGPGIAPADRDRVFDRFHRLPPAPEREEDSPPGSGLGLAIVRAIAERHGARVALAGSARLGGLRVTVDFPA